MATWRISDGTTYTLGGEVEGASLFAQELREHLATVQELSIAYPGPTIPFERDNPTHVDMLIRTVLAIPPFRGKLRVVEAPAVKPLPDVALPEAPEGAIY